MSPNQTDPPPATAGAQLVALALRALPAIGSAIGFVGFLTALGAAIAWVRFESVGLPADQVLGKIDRWELVTTGSLSLVLFSVLGGLAVLVAYLLGRRTLGTSRQGQAIVVLGFAELAFALFNTPAGDTSHWVGAAAVSALTVTSLAFIGMVGKWWTQRDELRPHIDRVTQLRSELAAAGPNAATEVINRIIDANDALERELRSWDEQLRGRREAWLQAKADAPRARLIAGLKTKVDDAKRGPGRDREREIGRADALVKAAEDALAADSILLLPIYHPVVSGIVLGVFLGVLAVFRYAFTDLRWMALILIVSTAINLATFFVALSARRFLWYGVAVLGSVTLFGATFVGIRTWRYPKVQSVAVLRKDSDRVVCGIYVAENDHRLYVGRVETAGDDPRGLPGTGRVTWIPESDVDILEIGVHQTPYEAQAEARRLAVDLFRNRRERIPVALKATTRVVTHAGARKGDQTVTTGERSPTKPGAPVAKAAPTDLPASCPVP